MATSEREYMRQQTDDATSIHPLFPWICWVLIAPLMTACGRKTAPSVAGGDEHRIVVAVIYSAPPALFRDSGGHVNGFMYDIEVELSRRLQMPFMYQPTSFENIITGIQSGKFDIGNGVDATPTRQEVVDIVPLYQGSYSFLVLADQGRRIGDQMDDLCGLTVGSVAGGSDGPTLTAQAKVCQDAGKPPVQLLRYDSQPNALLALRSHKVDAITAFSWYPALPGTQLSGPTFSRVQTGVALLKGSSLAPRLVMAMNDLIADGTYAKILARYNVSSVALQSASLNPAR
jgi:polar amino acid transport system substrate-binding protein